MNRLKMMLREKFDTDEVKFASLGGTATWGMRWPNDLLCAGEEAVVARFDGFETPLGKSGGMKLVNVCGVPVLRVPYHGWDLAHPSVEDSLRVFWVLQNIGVEQVIADASVGGITAEPWDVVVADDFIDTNSSPVVTRFAAQIGVRPWRRLAQPFCPRIREVLIKSVRRLKEEGTEEPHHELGRLKDRGVYHTIPLGLFETAAQIRWYQHLGVDIVGQSTGQEAMLARTCDMCFAGIYIVANYAEGLPGDWSGEGMDNLYRECAIPMGVIVMWTLQELVKQERSCGCGQIAGQTSHAGLPVPGA